MNHLLSSVLSLPALTWWLIGLGASFLLQWGWWIFAPKPWVIDFSGKHDVPDYWWAYSWVGLAQGMVVTGVLWLIAPWWTRGAVVPGREILRAPRWFWPLVVLAMGLMALFAFPRLDQSLWDDEELSVRDSILGKFKVHNTPDQEVKFLDRDWEQTWLEYRTPNNHVLNGVLSRLCHEWVSRISDPQGLPFREWPLRLPAYFAGVAAIGALAWMLLGFGRPVAGVVAAFLAALHPWHLRFAAECRGYGLVLLLVPLVIGCWYRAVFRGGWVWWIACAACQLALAVAYPGTLFVLLVLNGLTPFVLLFQHGAATPSSRQLGRWFSVNALSSLPAVTLFLPLIMQARQYISDMAEQGFAINAVWVWNEVNYFLLGVPWYRASEAGAEYPEVLFRFGAGIWVYWVILAVATLFAVIGVFRMVNAGLAGITFTAAVLFPPLMTCGFSLVKTQIIYEAYILYALPGLIALVGLGAEFAVGLAGNTRIPRSKMLLGASALLVVLSVYAWATQPFRSWLMTHSLQPLPESVLMTRGSLDPGDESSSHFLTGSYCIPPYLYDPRGVRLDSTRDLIELMRFADQTGRPLALNIGMPWAARDYSPEMWKLTNESKLFHPPLHLRGWDPGLDRLIFWYKPGSSQNFDFSAVDMNAR